MPWATFFISTGRCGTQWLAAQLQRHLADTAVVEHEPLSHYASSHQLLSPSDADAGVVATREHVARVEHILTQQDYIECGWPCWRALTYLRQRLHGRVRFVHLTRHPIPVACSWVAYGAYVPPLSPVHPARILFEPTDADAALSEYQARWDHLNAFEKVLYFWAEVNQAALDLHAQHFQMPWLHLTYENLFYGSGWEPLCAFLGRSAEPISRQEQQTRIDRFRFLAMTWWEPRCIQEHPLVMALAEQFGYNPMDFDEAALQRRYLPGF